MENNLYPGVIDRVKALMADSAVLLLLMVVFSFVFSCFQAVPDEVRIMSFAIIFFLYDPILTSLFGGTLGHMAIGIRVKREKDQRKNIAFPLAVIRFLIKSSLGWISLLSVTFNIKKRAIHDFISGSVVVFHQPEGSVSTPADLKEA